MFKERKIPNQWRIQDFMLGEAKNKNEKQKKVRRFKNLGKIKIGFFPVISSTY